ncbi:MAG: 23S rRNA (adenine(2503)-C(2))-methyltransferase RlmN [Firmicutes bacterium]|jgi:23S rRNA (adenine2503-C2)-methyltransferase|nr:23S rRNA (adenine(2503)-C(2))-methyltransferase RlmN [Bacillota bacterium]
MFLEELSSEIVELGEKKFRAKQVNDWVVKGVSDFDQMKNISKGLKELLKDNFILNNMSIVRSQKSKDGTIKYLMKLHDNHVIESVLMKYKHGNTLCVSTQVGCRMGCSFCASTIGGKARDLSAGEILGQVYEAQNDTGEKVSNIVLMGSGEPLDNYDEVLKFIRLVNDENNLNISMRNITLSTCGIVPEIRKLMKEKLQITLAISLHAVDNGKRDNLIPVNKKYPIEELLETCKDYVKETGRRITFEYSLIEGENDSVAEAEKLAKLLRGMLCHVNLIPINPVREKKYKASKSQSVNKFRDALKRKGIEATVRRELGQDIDAACGQLRKSYLDDVE